LIALQEDEHGLFTIAKDKSGYIKVYNNSTELVFKLGAPITSYAQQMQAHMGALYLEKADNVLVIGSGYGITAGAFTLYDTVKSIEAVEISPLMVEHASMFAPFNFEYHKNPKVKTIVSDGRHYLATSKKEYDIISINLSDPYLPGESSCFTKEFYALAKTKLSDSGVIVQHVFGPDFVSLIKTAETQFQYIAGMRAYGNSYNLLLSDKPIRFNTAHIHKMFNHNKKLKKELTSLKIIAPELYLQKILKGSKKINNIINSSNKFFINTDENLKLEFRWLSNLKGNFYSNH